MVKAHAVDSTVDNEHVLSDLLHGFLGISTRLFVQHLQQADVVLTRTIEDIYKSFILTNLQDKILELIKFYEFY